MADRQLPSIELLRQLLRYEPETGKLFWLQRSDARPEWNSRYADKEAFTSTNKQGYRVGAINDRLYRAHRVAWAIHYGEWSEDQIDHINRNRDDNRIENLRAASNTENARNRVAVERSTSKYKGVCWDKNRQKWCAKIRNQGRTVNLGRFSSEQDAYAAYCRAAFLLHGEFARVA